MEECLKSISKKNKLNNMNFIIPFLFIFHVIKCMLVRHLEVPVYITIR